MAHARHAITAPSLVPLPQPEQGNDFPCGKARCNKFVLLENLVTDRQSSRRYQTYSQVDFRKNSMGGVSKTFGGSRIEAIFERYADAFSQMRVSKMLFQNKMHT